MRKSLLLVALLILTIGLLGGCSDKNKERQKRLDKYFSTDIRLPSISTTKKTLSIEYERAPINQDTKMIPLCPELALRVVESNLTRHEYEIPKLLIRDKKGTPYDAKTTTDYYILGTQIVWELCWEANGTVRIETTELKHELLEFKDFLKNRQGK